MVKELCEQELKRGTLRRKAEGSEWDTWLIMILWSVWLVWFRKMKCIRHQSWNSKGVFPRNNCTILCQVTFCPSWTAGFSCCWIGAVKDSGCSSSMVGRKVFGSLYTDYSILPAPCKRDDRMTTCGYSYSRKPPALATKQPQSSKNMKNSSYNHTFHGWRG